VQIFNGINELRKLVKKPAGNTALALELLPVPRLAAERPQFNRKLKAYLPMESTTYETG
jgi:hypothetical protein